MHCIILGATGLVGQELLALAINSEAVTRITAPTRRPLPPHAKLFNPIVDFAKLPPEAPWWQADVALCALGSTLKQAGSRPRFVEIDHDYVLQSAEYLRAAGTPTFIYNSSVGADVAANSFYLQVKGQIETDLAAVGFPCLGIVRPSLLDGGARPERRLAESAGLVLAKLFEPLIPKGYRAVKTSAVAQAMWQLARTAQAGLTVVESADIYALQQQSNRG